MLLTNGAVLVGATGVLLAVVGLIAAWCMPNVPAADPTLRLSPNLFAETWPYAAPRRVDPADLAVGAGPVVVLDHGRHAC